MTLIHIAVSGIFAEALASEPAWLSIVCGTAVGLALAGLVWTPLACILGDLAIVSVPLGLLVPLPMILSVAELSHMDREGVDTFRYLEIVFPLWYIVWALMALCRLALVVYCGCSRKEF